jgi:hypothetical protein
MTAFCLHGYFYNYTILELEDQLVAGPVAELGEQLEGVVDGLHLLGCCCWWWC